MTRLIAALTLTTLACTTPRAITAAPAPTAEVRSAALDVIALDTWKKHPRAGMVVGVARKGRVIYLRAFGSMDAAGKEPATPDSVFCVGSVSKTFAAVAALSLEESGALRLADPVRRHWDGLREEYAAVTIEHLLRHTTGLPDYEYTGPWAKNKARPRSKAQVAATFQDRAPHFAPGSKWAYSSSGYYALGLVIEAAARQTWEAYLRAAVFQRAGLTRTRVCGPSDRGFAARKGGGIKDAEPVDLAQYGLAGGICSSVPDLLRFSRALARDDVFGARTYQRMQQPTLVPGAPSFGYGLGLAIGTFGGHRMLGHSGGVPGFTAQLRHYPGADLTIVVLTNTSSRGAQAVERALAKHLLSVPPPKRLAPAADLLRRLTGRYRTRDGYRFSLQAEAGTLVFRTRTRSIRMFYQGGSTFTDKSRAIRLDISGSATQSTLRVDFYGDTLGQIVRDPTGRP